MNYLTKIALPIYSRGYDIICLEVKKELNDEDIVAKASKLVPPTTNPIVNGLYDWAIFDIPDISINKNETYYICCSTDNSSIAWRYVWYCKLENVYKNGQLYISDDYGSNWINISKNDACFVTYGEV
jgi:hypothetical protein